MKQAGSCNDARWNEGPPDTSSVVESKPTVSAQLVQPPTATVSSSESSSDDSSSDSGDDNVLEVRAIFDNPKDNQWSISELLEWNLLPVESCKCCEL